MFDVSLGNLCTNMSRFQVKETRVYYQSNKIKHNDLVMYFSPKYLAYFKASLTLNTRNKNYACFSLNLAFTCISIYSFKFIYWNCGTRNSLTEKPKFPTVLLYLVFLNAPNNCCWNQIPNAIRWRMVFNHLIIDNYSIEK